MSTYVIVSVCLCSVIALALVEMLRSRKLYGTTSEERLAHQYEYEQGFALLFKRLPSIHLFGKLRLGSLGSLLVFIVVVPWVLCLLASIADGTLSLPGDDIGFLDDYGGLAILVASAVTFHLFRRAMNMVPATLGSLLKYPRDNVSQEKTARDIEKHLEKVAVILFQTEGARGRWGRVLDLGLTITFAGLIAYVYAVSVSNPPEPGAWDSPKYLWGNMLSIVLYNFIFAYVVRIGLGYIVRLVWSIWYLGKALNKDGLLRIDPLNCDGAGGLGEFGRLTWGIALILLPSLCGAVYFYVLEDVDPQYIISLSIAILLIPIFFFGPLWSVHRAMSEAKKTDVEFLSKQYNRNESIIRRWLEGEEDMRREEMLEAQEDMKRVLLLYEPTSRMPVWPFNHATLTSVAVYFLLPVTIVVIQNVLW